MEYYSSAVVMMYFLWMLEKWCMDAPFMYLRMEFMWLILLDPGLSWDDKT